MLLRECILIRFQGADIEERNTMELNAFHIATFYGHHSIMEWFFETYSVKDDDYVDFYRTPSTTSNLALAVESSEPEAVWLILDRGLAKPKEVNAAWTAVAATGWVESMLSKDRATRDPEKLDDIRKLIMTHGGFTVSIFCPCLANVMC